MFILATTIFFVLSFYFLHHGLRVLITKRPFLFSSKNVFWVAALAFLPNIIFPINSFWKHYSFDAETSAPFDWTISFLLLIPLVMYPALLIFYWRILRGYGVLGVTDESFRQALYSVLQELKLPYEERLSKMHLISLDADLEANVNGWLGTATIRMKQKEHQDTLGQIASALSRYFAGSHVATNMVTSTYYLIFGVLTFTTALSFGYFFVLRDI